MSKAIKTTETMEQLFENYKASVNEESALTPEQSETLTALESITDQVHTDSEYVTYQRTYDKAIAYARASEKAGFVLEGVMRRGVYKRGEVLDYCMYALVPDDAPGGGSGL